MQRLNSVCRLPEFHVFIFCLLSTLINWPFLGVMGDKGLKSTFTYLLVVWAIFIAFLALIQKAIPAEADEDKDDQGGA